MTPEERAKLVEFDSAKDVTPEAAELLNKAFDELNAKFSARNKVPDVAGRRNRRTRKTKLRKPFRNTFKKLARG